MNNDTEAVGPFEGIFRFYVGFRNISPIRENLTEKNMELDMEAGSILLLVVYYPNSRESH